MEDMTQGKRMWTLRVKIDSWSNGKVDEATRQRNRELLLEAYLRLPPRRVWMHVKIIRFAILHAHYEIEHEDEVFESRPEDEVARGMFQRGICCQDGSVALQESRD